MSSEKNQDSALRNGSFLARWTKRKAEVRAEVAKEAAKTEQKTAVDEGAISANKSNANTSTGAEFEAKMPENSRAEPSLAKNKSEVVAPLPSIDGLTGESDFSPFMQNDVAPEMRNQAMKKLFTDPHYNIMDGLDTYIDDYGKPDPIPPAMLRMLNQSKFLRLFEDEEKAEAAAAELAATDDQVGGHDDSVSQPTLASSADQPGMVTISNVNTVDAGKPVLKK